MSHKHQTPTEEDRKSRRTTLSPDDFSEITYGPSSPHRSLCKYVPTSNFVPGLWRESDGIKFEDGPAEKPISSPRPARIQSHELQAQPGSASASPRRKATKASKSKDMGKVHVVPMALTNPAMVDGPSKTRGVSFSTAHYNTPPRTIESIDLTTEEAPRNPLPKAFVARSRTTQVDLTGDSECHLVPPAIPPVSSSSRIPAIDLTSDVVHEQTGRRSRNNQPSTPAPPTIRFDLSGLGLRTTPTPKPTATPRRPPRSPDIFQFDLSELRLKELSLPPRSPQKPPNRSPLARQTGSSDKKQATRKKSGVSLNNSTIKQMPKKETSSHPSSSSPRKRGAQKALTEDNPRPAAATSSNSQGDGGERLATKQITEARDRPTARIGCLAKSCPCEDSYCELKLDSCKCGTVEIQIPQCALEEIGELIRPLVEVVRTKTHDPCRRLPGMLKSVQDAIANSHIPQDSPYGKVKKFLG
ncbi:hypothetical protein BJ508DRAFT_334992 [Ascobolus immersus RN42]|uniref:Uncharacterized protein n=1 Tax=Ascobolus immersus RN42 TaxID=1160509 RepID=A0A3N4HHI2_ASCIM|nr:hypothetical protein BJ508DRAFT_334992 [Ascobolus immersus RN42]